MGSCGQTTQTIRSRRRESPKLEVQPYVPSTPVLYLGMDDDNGRKEGGKNEQFGEGWERDPNRINPHLQVKSLSKAVIVFQVMWDDLIGEPEGVRSLDCTWNCSKTCFQGTLSCCYTVMTVLYAPLFALFAGLNFACLTFVHIWAYGPCLRSLKINYAFFRKVNQIMMASCCAPCVETCGLVLSKIRVRQHKMHDGMKDEDPEKLFIA